MGDKVASDEKNFENITIKNRPMRIAEEYEEFCSNAWLSGKEKLDDCKVQPVHALNILSDILKV